MASECIFCKIISGEIPSKTVLENEDCLVFLDIFPANIGHCLVIPKVHYQDIFDIPAQAYSAIAKTAHQVASLLKERLGCEGVTILQANQEAGWQSVFHIHMHVIPRWLSDSLHKPWDIAAATEEELVAMQSTLTKSR